jgi:hypothetical protein
MLLFGADQVSRGRKFDANAGAPPHEMQQERHDRARAENQQ